MTSQEAEPGHHKGTKGRSLAWSGRAWSKGGVVWSFKGLFGLMGGAYPKRGVVWIYGRGLPQKGRGLGLWVGLAPKGAWLGFMRGVSPKRGVAWSRGRAPSSQYDLYSHKGEEPSGGYLSNQRPGRPSWAPSASQWLRTSALKGPVRRVGAPARFSPFFSHFFPDFPPFLTPCPLPSTPPSPP